MMMMDLKKTRIRQLVMAVFLMMWAGGMQPHSPALYAQHRGGMMTADDLSKSFADVANRVKPSVVTISSVKKVEVSGSRSMPFFGFPFQDFFGQDIPEGMSPEGSEREYLKQGLGTGLIVSETGNILTNHHVIKDADKIQVKVDGRDETYEARVIGTDPKTDLAVIQIEADNLKPAQLGDSGTLKVGEWVVAAGNPFGLSYTITAGIVSAKGRAHVSNVEYEDFIQTDAAINPGNSGGPLINLDGEVVGINTAIFSRSGGYMGIGFAIPSNMASSVMTSLIEKGKVVRGWLGVAIQNLSQGLAQSFDYDSTDGVLIGQIMTNSPAEKAGLQEGDIIMEYGGKKVEDVQELRYEVADTEPGTRVRLRIFRDGDARDISVKIGELKTETQAADSQINPSLGIQVRTMTERLARRLGVDQTNGVIVSAIEPLGLAARQGISVGDIILKVGNETISDRSHFWELIKQRDLEEGVRLVVQRQGQRVFIFLQKE